jgi:hypothetical protein
MRRRSVTVSAGTGSTGESHALDRAFAEVDQLLAAIAAWPDDERKATARDLARVLLELHRQGLARLLRAAGPAAGAAVADPAIDALLVLHELHPASFDERARDAVDRARGAYPDLRLLSVTGRVVMVGAGARGGSVSAVLAIERALLEQLPDADRIVVRPDEVDLVQLRRREPAP